MGLRSFNAGQLDRKAGLYTTLQCLRRTTLFHNLMTLFHNRTTPIRNPMTLFLNLVILFRTPIPLFLNPTTLFLLRPPSPSTCFPLPFLCLCLLPPKPRRIRFALLSIQTSLSPSPPSKRPPPSLYPLQSLPLAAVPKLSAIPSPTATSRLRATLCFRRTTSRGEPGCPLAPFRGFDSG